MITKLDQEINAILTGLEITGGTPEEAAARYAKDYAVFNKVIEEAVIRLARRHAKCRLHGEES